MISTFEIENYKSIEKLNLNLGRINVFIGENGCGKSNILEAFVLASAASQNKLDNEFLTSRGVRVTSPELMRSAFEIEKATEPIKLSFTILYSRKFSYKLSNDNQLYSKWISEEVKPDLLDENKKRDNKDSKELFIIILEQIKNLVGEKKLPQDSLLEPFLTKKKSSFRQGGREILTFLENSWKNDIENFLIYSPENTSLRTFEKEGQIEPLGIYGAGLFKLLKYFAAQEGQESLHELKEHLKLFGWFKDFTMPTKLFEGESFLQIKDKFIDEKIAYFDQKSANEGFLFVLFYISLLISDKTPSFFAIDNIEASLNPKLCTKLIKNMAELTKKHHKQVIVTTHSPAILDGLDLNDAEQKLFLVYRNKNGRTVVKELQKPQAIDGEEPIKLSEAFLRGYLGGLPKNFSI